VAITRRHGEKSSGEIEMSEQTRPDPRPDEPAHDEDERDPHAPHEETPDLDKSDWPPPPG
jgi:hypothetical protein